MLYAEAGARAATSVGDLASSFNTLPSDTSCGVRGIIERCTHYIMSRMAHRVANRTRISSESLETMSMRMASWKSDPDKGPFRVDVDRLHRISGVTIAHYDRLAEEFRDGTRDHDVSQNCSALLDAIEGDRPYSILDLGCGPGRDLHYFRALGHDVVGLDGSKEFVVMARAYSGCEVLHQDFLAMELPKSRFDGVFANASLFHVPSQDLPRVLLELFGTLKPGGVLFCSNPRGNNEEGFRGDRYSCFFGRWQLPPRCGGAGCCGRVGSRATGWL